METLRGLSFVQLHVVAAACRVQLQLQSESQLAECSVERIVNEFDKLTGMLRRKARNHYYSYYY